jgi:hypothetical protein
MKDSTLNDLIDGGLRTLVQFVPVVGGPYAQAWSEYEAHRQKERIEEFFRSFGNRMKSLEAQVSDLGEHVKQLTDAPELLEEIVENVRGETQDPKRQFYVNMLVSFVREPTATSRDERRSIIQDLDILTLQDLDYLQKFQNGVLRGDWVTATGFAEFEDASQRGMVEAKYEKLLGPAIHSLAKLQARGLITRTAVNAMFGWSGDANAWYNRFRNEAWRMMPIGEKLLRSIKE